MKFWYRVCFVLVRVGLFFWHPVLRVQGLENLTKGAAVLCGNHSSAADPLWIILALRQPELFRIMAKSELRRAVHRMGHGEIPCDLCTQGRA